MDNAPWHNAEQVKEKEAEWESKNLYIFRLPPYCPHLNLIEILWRKMKYQWLNPADYKDKASLHEAVNKLLLKFNSEGFKLKFEVNI